MEDGVYFFIGVVVIITFVVGYDIGKRDERRK
jgi:hypothetical protein